MGQADLRRPSADQGQLRLANQDPGLNSLQVWVNSQLQTTVSLTPSEYLNLDVTAAMTEAENTISFVGFGELGRKTRIIITDSAPGDYPVTTKVAEFSPDQNPIWGPLAEYVEDNTGLQVADSTTHTVHLNLSRTPEQQHRLGSIDLLRRGSVVSC